MSRSPWSKPPSSPQLPEGTVDVWRADLDAADDALAALLSPDEAARAARFTREDARRRWARAHGILRVLLGAYLDCDPRALRFEAGPHGKPDLAASVSLLRFNLSHSAEVALYAFATEVPVGVDIEVRRRPIDPIGLARRAFGPQEARRLAVLEPAAREQEFLHAWTRHEAILKCLGVGIATPEGDRQRPPVWVAELDVGPDAAAAVAVQGDECAVRRREWPMATPLPSHRAPHAERPTFAAPAASRERTAPARRRRSGTGPRSSST
jgi:4'-phosphopantetheinyl transferase